jgi:hypothetical protein
VQGSALLLTPVVKSLSDHNAQFFTDNNFTTKVNLMPLKQRTRKINNETIAQFQRVLQNKMWEPVFKIKDKYSNSFSYAFLNISEVSLPIQNKTVGRAQNDWITQGIEISCKHKKLFVSPLRPYSVIPSRVIKESKRHHCH